MRVNHNLPALFANNAYNSTLGELEDSVQKLSSGLRINSAADDAAGLAVSEKMRAQVRGLDQAVRNSQDGISMIQTAEGALNETHGILQRMRELSVQAANDTLTQQDRSFIQIEIDQLREEIDRVGNTTQFNKKKLLDGSAAALWSSSDLSTKAIVNGGLRVTDQFGQKSSEEGNYKISIEASPGQGQVQKTNSFVIEPEPVPPPRRVFVPAVHPDDDVKVPITIYDFFGAAVTHTEDMPDPFPMGANGVLSFPEDDFADVVIVGGLEFYISVDEDYYFLNNLTPKDTPRLKVTDVQGWYTKDDGSGGVIDGITFDAALLPRIDTYIARPPTNTATLTSGGKAVAKIDLDVFTKDYDVYWGGVHYQWDDDAGMGWPTGAMSNYWSSQQPVDISLMVGSTPYNLNADDVAGKLVKLYDVAGGNPPPTYTEMDFRGVTADAIRGLVVASNPGESAYDSAAAPALVEGTLVHIDYGPDPTESALGDLDLFINSEGRSLLATPQTITVTQGDGKRASFTLYADDTIASLLEKLNDAIGTGLGQANYTDTGGKFAQFVSDPEAYSALSAYGTIVISSIVPGQDGRLFFSGDEELMKAFGLNVIQQAEESDFAVTVTDAHSGLAVGTAQVTGNKLIGVLGENIDVTFDIMSDTRAVYNEDTGYFELVKTDGAETLLHLADNTTVFQIGTNEGEDIGINIGDMRAHALNLGGVLVTDREAASRSITILDNAIDKVSRQRAKLGAYQNRLEHTISNLTVSGENLTAAESRIRDTDMAKEMLSFTKLNILLQSGSAMMTQANQISQAVLSLLR